MPASGPLGVQVCTSATEEPPRRIGVWGQAGADSLKTVVPHRLCTEGARGREEGRYRGDPDVPWSELLGTELRAVLPAWDAVPCTSLPVLLTAATLCPSSRAWLRTSLGRVMKVTQSAAPSSQGCSHGLHFSVPCLSLALGCLLSHTEKQGQLLRVAFRRSHHPHTCLCTTQT